MKNEIGERPERRFETRFTDIALQFLKELDVKGRKKILSNIRTAEVTINDELFKKLRDLSRNQTKRQIHLLKMR